MRFKLDENLPADAASVLRSHGHDAATVLEQKLGGCRDPLVLAACQREKRVIVTLDTDFTNIMAYPPAGLRGVVVLRPKFQGKPSVLRILERLVIPRLDKDPLEGRLWVVDDTRVRSHG